MLTPDQRRRTARTAFSKHLILGLILFCILRLVSNRSDWYRAWIYCAIVTGTQMAAGLLLLKRNPELLLESSKIQKGTKSWDKWLVPAMGGIGPLATAGKGVHRIAGKGSGRDHPGRGYHRSAVARQTGGAVLPRVLRGLLLPAAVHFLWRSYRRKGESAICGDVVDEREMGGTGFV